MSSEAIKIYNSISELYASMGSRVEQDVDFTIHRLEEVLKKIPSKSSLFRTNYYSVLIVRKGRGCYIIDDQSYLQHDSTIYFTNPGHVKGFEIYELLHGYILTFSEDV